MITISSQWDDKLLLKYSEYKEIKEVYGSLRKGIIGSTRPAMFLPDVTIDKAKKHIELAHSLGIEFNYILNASCLGNLEFTADGQKKIMDYLRLIIDKLDVDVITVANPFLIELIKSEYPHVKIKASEIADIKSAQRARFYKDLGADILTIEIMYNRDFETLKAIRKAVNVELEVVVNSACILHCPFHDYHNNITSHTTQKHYNSFYIDYCVIKCLSLKLLNPSELIKAPWIRPEDLGEYEKIGINRFKISNRVGRKDFGLKCLDAYSKRNWNGNLAELLTPLM